MKLDNILTVTRFAYRIKIYYIRSFVSNEERGKEEKEKGVISFHRNTWLSPRLKVLKGKFQSFVAITIDSRYFLRNNGG